MSKTFDTIAAVIGANGLVVLAFPPGPMPVGVRSVALALMVGCLASLLLSTVWRSALSGLLTRGSTGRRGAYKAGPLPWA